MPTATRTEYVTIGGLLMATTAIDAHDWFDLMGSSPKRGEDVTVPGQAGVADRTRVTAAHRGLVLARVNGKWDHATGASTGTTVADWTEGAYQAYALVQAVADTNTTQTLQLVRPAATVTADCLVLDFRPRSRPVPWVWELLLDVKLPDGPLTI